MTTQASTSEKENLTAKKRSDQTSVTTQPATQFQDSRTTKGLVDNRRIHHAAIQLSHLTASPQSVVQREPYNNTHAVIQRDKFNVKDRGAQEHEELAKTNEDIGILKGLGASEDAIPKKAQESPDLGGFSL